MPAAAARPPPCGKLPAQAVGAVRCGQRRTHAHPPVAAFAGGQYDVRASGCTVRELVGEQARHAPAPRCIRQFVDLGPRARECRRQRPRRREIRACAVAQRPDHRLGRGEVERIAVAAQDRVEIGRTDDEVLCALPAAGVGERLAETPQLAGLGVVEREAPRQPLGARAQVVAVGRDDRPRPVAAVEVPVHQHRGADVRRGVDRRRESRVHGHGACVMVIEPGHVDAASEEGIECRPVDVERDVEHRDAVPFPRVDPREQADVALRAGDEMAVPRRGESKLMQRAQPVGIPVEDVVAGHRVTRCSRGPAGGGTDGAAARGRCRVPCGHP